MADAPETLLAHFDERRYAMRYEKKFDEWMDGKISIEPPDGAEYVACSHSDTWNAAVKAVLADLGFRGGFTNNLAVMQFVDEFLKEGK